MPKGYTLKPDVQMKVEDERAGRLDYTYETKLSADECLARIGNKTDGRLSEYETLTKDGVLYILFKDPMGEAGGLHVDKPSKYAVRFESVSDKTVIRVRYIWDQGSASIPYLLKEDMDTFFADIFDARVSDDSGVVWIDSAEDHVNKDPLKIHGSRAFWPIAAVFAILWVVIFVVMSVINS